MGIEYIIAALLYIDGGGWQVTLPEIVSEFRTITWVELEKVNLEKGGFRFKVGKPIKGRADADVLGLRMTWGEGGAPFKELKAGHAALHFTQSCVKELRGAASPEFEALISRRATLTFVDGLWFHTTPDVDGWQLGTVRRDFELAFSGTTAELADAVTRLLRGDEIRARCRRQKHTAELAWVRYALKTANDKILARDPAAAPAASRPVAAWVADLKSPTSSARLEAALALAELGAGDVELAAAARDPDPEVRCAAVAALRPGGKGAVESLARALGDDDWFTRLAAAKALQRFGAEGRPALPALVHALSPRDGLKDFRPIRCGEALVALSRVDPGAKEIPAACALVVSKLLRDERQGSFGARARGARLLGACGAPAASAAPALTELLRDPDGDVRVAAAEALLKIAPSEAATTALIDALRASEPLVRRRAAEALGGLKIQEARGALEIAAKDGEPEVRAAAIDALTK